MENPWRPLTREEMSDNGIVWDKQFGSFFPNLLQKILINIGNKTILKRGVFRGGFTNLILSLSKGPLDVLFRGCSYRIWGENNLIEYGILLNPNYNHLDIDFLLSNAPLNANFIDIGSNIGLYSLPMAKKSIEGKTLSIDANPLMVSRLKFNAAASNLKNITVLSVAVSDSDGQGSLIIRKDDVAIVAIEESIEGLIPIRTLSSLIEEQGIKEIYGLKIDIEGHEDKALAPFLIKAPKSQLPKKIVIEHPHPNSDYPECSKAFSKRNYQLIGRSRNNSFYELID